MRRLERLTTIITILLVFTLCAAPGIASARIFSSVTPEALKAMIDKGDRDILVVDTRPKGIYTLGHIPGSTNFPWAPEITSPGDLPYDRLLVLYCATENEKEAREVAEQLQTWDYVRMRILKGGWRAWEVMGYPAEQGGGSIGSITGDIPRITIQELKAMMDRGERATILDVQTKAVYDKGHIKGALSLPWKAKLAEADVRGIPKAGPVVLYCDCGPGESDSEGVAGQLKGFGFGKVLVLRDPSIRGWRQAGYPME